jgi:hypothetical protein
MLSQVELLCFICPKFIFFLPKSHSICCLCTMHRLTLLLVQCWYVFSFFHFCSLPLLQPYHHALRPFLPMDTTLSLEGPPWPARYTAGTVFILSFFLSFLLTSSFAAESLHSTTLLADGHTLSLEGPPWPHHQPRRCVNSNGVWQGQDMMMLICSSITLCLAVVRHLAVPLPGTCAMSPGPHHLTCHVAVPLTAARAISPCFSTIRTALLGSSHQLAFCWCIFFFFFFLSTTTCGPVTTLPHHALC